MVNNVNTFSILFDCTASMVIYNNPPEMIRKAALSFLDSKSSVQLTIVDNSPTSALRSAFEALPVEYLFYGNNVGYGAGHNLAIQNAADSRYHLILNPDIVIPSGTIAGLVQFMDNHPDVGMVCPKVLNEDGSTQYLNRRYPNVFDLFARRFVPRTFQGLLKNRLARYETRDIGYDTVHDVEFMTGAFMFCRTDVLNTVHGFDDRYFMYFEDCDLGQRFQQHGLRTVYYPEVSVTHLWERASHKSLKMTWVFIVNMCRYFNKWGWKWL
jgi:GT2 family glycosyltransferase